MDICTYLPNNTTSWDSLLPSRQCCTALAHQVYLSGSDANRLTITFTQYLPLPYLPSSLLPFHCACQIHFHLPKACMGEL